MDTLLARAFGQYNNGQEELVNSEDLVSRASWGYDVTETDIFNTFDEEDTKAWLALDRAIRACSATGGGTVWAPGYWKVTRPIVLRENVTVDFMGGTLENIRPRHTTPTGSDAIKLNAFACRTVMHYAIFNPANSVYHSPSAVSGPLGAGISIITFADSSAYLNYSQGDDILIRTAGAASPSGTAVNPYFVQNNRVASVAANQITLEEPTAKDFGDSPLVVKLGQVSDTVTGAPFTFTRNSGIRNVKSISNGAFWNRCNFRGIRLQNIHHTGFDGSTANGLNDAHIKRFVCYVKERGLEYKISQNSIIDGYHAYLTAGKKPSSPLFSWGQISSCAAYNVKGVENANAQESKFRVVNGMELTLHGLKYEADGAGSILQPSSDESNQFNALTIYDCNLIAKANSVGRFMRIKSVGDVSLLRVQMEGQVDIPAGAVWIESAGSGEITAYKFVNSPLAAVRDNINDGQIFPITQA